MRVGSSGKGHCQLPSQQQETNYNDFVTDMGQIVAHQNNWVKDETTLKKYAAGSSDLGDFNSHSCNKRKGQQMAAWTTAQWGNPAILGNPATWGCLLQRCAARLQKH